MTKKILGYGFKLSSESVRDALNYYDLSIKFLCKTRKQTLMDIKKAKEDGCINKTAKPRVFKVVVEIE
jgi:hypothetical protein